MARKSRVVNAIVDKSSIITMAYIKNKKADQETGIPMVKNQAGTQA